MKKHYRHEHDCLNCGSELQGKFCHNCGQENLQIKESFGHMLNHAVSDYFHFDHQFFHTLKPLLFQPGKLTIEYMAGRRAQYLHPVKMYIFISLVYFLLIFKSNHEVVNINEGKNNARSEVAKDINKDLDKDTSLTEAQKKKIKELKSFVPGSATSVNISKDGSPIVITEDKTGKRNPDSTIALYTAHQQKLPANKRDGFFERFYKTRALTYKQKYGDNAQEVFKEEVKHNMPKMMFVLLPLFALMLRVAFWKNHKYYVEHLIYAIHLHCYFFLFSGIVLLIQMLVPQSWDMLNGVLSTIVFIYTLWYLYRSLKMLYQRSRLRTITKMMGIAFVYLITFSVCMMGLVMITAATA